MLSAEYSCKRFKPIFAYPQTVQTLIRLLLKEQSELGPHCLQKNDFQNHKQMTKQMAIVVIGSLRVKKLLLEWLWQYFQMVKILCCLCELIPDQLFYLSSDLFICKLSLFEWFFCHVLQFSMESICHCLSLLSWGYKIHCCFNLLSWGIIMLSHNLN